MSMLFMYFIFASWFCGPDYIAIR